MWKLRYNLSICPVTPGLSHDQTFMWLSRQKSLLTSPKKLSQILTNKTGGIGSCMRYVQYCQKKKRKIKRGLEKSSIFLLKLSLLNNVWGIQNGFVTNYVPAWRPWPSKISSAKINERYNEFLLLKKNILSIQSVLLYLYAMLDKKVLYFLIEHTTKVAWKVSSTDHTI